MLKKLFVLLVLDQCKDCQGIHNPTNGWQIDISRQLSGYYNLMDNSKNTINSKYQNVAMTKTFKEREDKRLYDVVKSLLGINEADKMSKNLETQVMGVFRLDKANDEYLWPKDSVGLKVPGEQLDDNIVSLSQAVFNSRKDFFYPNTISSNNNQSINNSAVNTTGKFKNHLYNNPGNNSKDQDLTRTFFIRHGDKQNESGINVVSNTITIRNSSRKPTEMFKPNYLPPFNTSPNYDATEVTKKDGLESLTQVPEPIEHKPKVFTNSPSHHHERGDVPEEEDSDDIKTTTQRMGTFYHRPADRSHSVPFRWPTFAKHLPSVETVPAPTAPSKFSASLSFVRMPIKHDPYLHIRTLKPWFMVREDKNFEEMDKSSAPEEIMIPALPVPVKFSPVVIT